MAELTRHSIRLRKGDLEVLQDRFPKQGANAIIRSVVSKIVDKLSKPISAAEEKELGKIPGLGDLKEEEG